MRTSPTKIATLFAVLAALATTVAAVSPAGADDAGTLRQLQQREAAVRVQLNLAIADTNAVETEAARLQSAVASEQALVAADQSSEAAADSRVAVVQSQLTALQQQGAAARQALVDRAIDLYENPYQDSELLLTGVQSFDELETRQVLTDAVEAKTSDLIDAVHSQTELVQAASRDLFAAQKLATQRRIAAQNETQVLQTALASEQTVAASLTSRVSDDDSQLVTIGAQESALEAKLNAAASQYAGELNGLVINLGPVGSYGLQWPIHGIVTQEFGHNGHPGIDIAAPYGTAIVASGSGVVIYASWESGYGNYTCIDHGGGISTCYGHQSYIGVTVGQQVTRGEFIGREGSTGYSTGPHVHFEVRVNGVVHNPRDFVPGNP